MSFFEGVLLFIILAFISFFIQYYFPGYLRKKGENLADKEDIAKITNEIEEVKSQYQEKLQEIIFQNNQLLENLKWKNQIRLAALEKRLEKHQEAYVLLWKLLEHLSNPVSLRDTINECQNWYINNNLYLIDECRNEFSQAYHNASALTDFISYIMEEEENIQDRQERRSQIVGAIQTIARYILPSWKEEDEYNPVKIKTNSDSPKEG